MGSFQLQVLRRRSRAFDKDEKFGFIHDRALCGTFKDWLRFYRQAKHNLKSGGWLEMQTHDCWAHSDDDGCDPPRWTMEWFMSLESASRNFGQTINVAQNDRPWE